MGAPLHPVPEVLRVFLNGFVDNEDQFTWGNVLHVGYSGSAPDNTNCDTLANLFADAWNTQFAPECPAPTQLTDVTVTDLTSDSAAEGTWVGAHNGTRGDDSIPANAAVLISYPSALRYKGGHPRSYLYAGGNADLEGAAKWSTAFTAEVRTHWSNFLLNLLGLTVGSTTTSTVGWVRYRGKYLPNDGPPHYYLTTPMFSTFSPAEIVAHQEIASQRRRVGRRKA